MPDVSNPPGLTESGDVDHQQTTNRTHTGDDLSPATLEANLLNSADIENASSGEVPKSQGDGTLAMGSAGSVVTSIVPTEADSGNEPSTQDSTAIAIASGAAGDGALTIARYERDIVIGSGAQSDKLDGNATGHLAIGEGAIARTRYDGEPGIAIGKNAETGGGQGPIAIGVNADCGVGYRHTAIGKGAYADDNEDLALGSDTTAEGGSSIVIGSGNTANFEASRGVAIQGSVTAQQGIAIGPNTDTTGAEGIALGDGAQAGSQEFVLHLGFDNTVMSIDSNGNMTLSGSLTENGSP